MKDSIQIVTALNGVGLEQDANILRDILVDAGYPVTITHHENPAEGEFALNIFLEILSQAHIGTAQKSVLIPNPEWFFMTWAPMCRQLSGIWTKSKSAILPFSRLCPAGVENIGFTSRDMHTEVLRKRKFFHLAGRSTQKGTISLLEAWRRHPEWPHLTVVSSEVRGQSYRRQLGNYTLIDHRLNDRELKKLMNSCRFHLCPSEVEGFGHYIVEGMSCGAVVITTDKPPMSDHIQPDRGILVRTSGQRAARKATRYIVNYGEIEKAVEQALSLSPVDAVNMGIAAREWYEQNDLRFRAALLEKVGKVMGVRV